MLSVGSSVESHRMTSRSSVPFLRIPGAHVRSREPRAGGRSGACLSAHVHVQEYVLSVRAPPSVGRGHRRRDEQALHYTPKGIGCGFGKC